MIFQTTASAIDFILAVAAILLLLVSELLSPKYGQSRVKLSQKALFRTAVVVSFLFLIVLAMNTVSTLAS